MSQKANPTIIGAFVVGALFIVIAAVMILTSGELLKKKAEFVMYFKGSVKGLNVGAPVTYRGVDIGVVKKIEIVLSPDQSASIPVTVDINPEAFTRKGYKMTKSLDDFIQNVLDECRNDGLRAQLQIQSLLTGQLFIQIDYFPDTPADFVESGERPEIPTVPTTLEELGNILHDYPLRKVLDDVERTVAGLADLATSKELRETIVSVNQAFDDMSELARNLNTRTEPLESTIVETQRTMVQATDTLKAAEQTFNKATETLIPLKGLVGDDSELLDQLEEALNSLTEAANAAAALADTLEHQPEAIIKGKGTPGGD